MSFSKPDYQTYIKSNEWRVVSEETKRLADYRCQVCNKNEATSNLHVHHRTYERLGRELQSDLIALCGDCHSLFHGKTGIPDNYVDKDVPF